MASRRRTDEWGGAIGNDRRTAKMRTITMTEEAWGALADIADRLGTSRSGALEVLVLREKTRPSKKSASGA